MTRELHVFVFPLLSVAVRMIVVDGRLAQVINELLITIFEIPQASVVPLFTMNGLMITFPDPFSTTVILRQVVTGLIVSRTVTVEEQLAVKPKMSLTVRIAVFVPIFTQVKLFGLTEVNAIPQLSAVEVLSVAPLIRRLPAAFRNTVTFWQLTVGGIVSITVTADEQVDEFPL